MLLSELIKIKCFNELELIQDANFNTIGSFRSKNKDILAPCYDDLFLEKLISSDCISALLIQKSIYEKNKDYNFNNKGLIICESAQDMFFQIHKELMKIKNFFWKEFDTEIHQSSNIHKNAVISNKNVKIGKNCNIDAGVVIYDNVIIGDNCNIKANTVIGGNGFRVINGAIIKHTGSVQIGTNVEIGSNCNIDKGDYSECTTLGNNVKIDNIVHMGHNSYIGHNTTITACVIIAGSTNIGQNVYIGPNATISNALDIGDDAYITIGSVVKKNIPSNYVFFERKLVKKSLFNAVSRLHAK